LCRFYFPLETLQLAIQSLDRNVDDLWVSSKPIAFDLLDNMALELCKNQVDTRGVQFPLSRSTQHIPAWYLYRLWAQPHDYPYPVWVLSEQSPFAAFSGTDWHSQKKSRSIPRNHQQPGYLTGKLEMSYIVVALNAFRFFLARLRKVARLVTKAGRWIFTRHNDPLQHAHQG